jgi:hypothetical protein
MQTYVYGALAVLLAAATALQVATGQLGLAIVTGAVTLHLSASAIAARAPSRPATSNQGAARAVLDPVSYCALILAIVFLATGHPIWLACIAIGALARALRIWMLRGQPSRNV